MSSTTESRIATTKTIISTIGTIAATAMVARSIARDYVPPEIQGYFYLGLHNFFRRFSNQLTMVINEYDGIESNEIYDAAVIYLGSKVSPNTRRLKVTKPEQENSISLTMERNEEVIDTFCGVQFKWTWVCEQLEQSNTYYNRNQMRSFRSEVRSFELSFHKKHKEKALNSYLPFILKEAKDKKQEVKTLKIFTLQSEDRFSSSETWQSVSLDHPATFETLAMDVELKETVMKDLERFVTRREKYRKVGKAWKRGYLLYGPPGTGKSSLIAAMANYLKFDIYDLELTDLKRNSELRKLLIATANRSILVVEDIDCNMKLQDRATAAKAVPSEEQEHYREEANRVTLSGFLNFIDGLWSSCGDERIIIFTTNHKEKLDPALLRPGRMDMHIHMSYCTPCGFKLLAGNYLGVEDHKLFGEIEELIQTTEVTPAEVAEQLLKSDDSDVSLASLISFLQIKRKEKEEAEAEKATEKMSESVKKAGEDGQEGNQHQANGKI
ncbi:Protein hyper-sensitivity-related 4 [Heracleum sosnowskyi]|uniref:Protein hyper-sensitivity-related 4 n=1 Tax=Heracleum sosnowskyi TaxID=360622 RepID=A0AAD8HBZ0_9APIA|nr:Protein hyper-sensitivity-related 4 [Heracleum sosnowskyi]